MEAQYKYLHKGAGPNTWYLDHRILPEIRAVLAAMVSRIPSGGLVQRYEELLQSIRDGLVSQYPELVQYAEVEDYLTRYPIPQKIEEFIQKFIADYGHSSPLEFTGDPVVYIEGLSWWSAYRLFDSPLVSGQEASTRALDFSKRPICLEAQDNEDLVALHQEWLEVFEAEKQWWMAELRRPCQTCKGEGRHYGGPWRASLPTACSDCKGTGKKYPEMKDPQAFRPAFDRARWALPGTISTSVVFTSHVRERSRAIHDCLTVASRSRHQQSVALFQEIADTYKKALPGLAHLGLREAVYEDTERNVPAHLEVFPTIARYITDNSSYVRVDLTETSHYAFDTYVRSKGRTYVDPHLNQEFRVPFSCDTSIAALRDWHRHRTFYPLDVAVAVPPLADHNSFMLAPGYEPKSALAKENTEKLFKRSYRLYWKYRNAGNYELAMLTFPLGTRVNMGSAPGLRDFIYSTELRAFAHGANFEYEAQAKELLQKLVPLAEEMGILPALWTDEMLKDIK